MSKVVLLSLAALQLATGSIGTQRPLPTPLISCPETWGKVIIRNGKYVINFTSMPGEERYCEVQAIFEMDHINLLIPSKSEPRLPMSPLD